MEAIDTRVSEELNSVETEVRYVRRTESNKGFQKNLIVWKRFSSSSSTLDILMVSEELNSVETKILSVLQYLVYVRFRRT